MENNNVLDYADIPQVAMDAMNGVHRDELDIVNSINAAITIEDNSEITKLCEQWLAHTMAHFNKENAMMMEYGFPAYHCHSGEHNEALHELESVIHTWENTNNLDILAVYVRNTWPAWYVNHISTMDVVTSAFIKQSLSNN